ncbi:hypothetical protein DFH06DRAFT_672643 [Mycena polygramma]|nr:hypothetical protein DFH06DRAFT_672643 [Mycena polygramma]
MADPLSIAKELWELGMTIKESIDKDSEVVDNKKNLGDLKKEVQDTVDELTRLAEERGDKAPTRQLKTALEMLMKQLNGINTNCQALTQSKGIPAFVKAWFKRDEIEAEIGKLKENRTNCVTQFQLLALVRVEGATARTEDHTVLIEATATRTEGYAARTEAITTRTEANTARTEANTVQLVNADREKKIREWFQALDMREKQRATHALRHNDTGSWFLEDTKFTKWKEEPGYLWIRGNSGTGKSVLSSIAIDHLFDYRRVKVANSHPSTPKFGIAYFYFDFRDEKKQLVENMLRSIIMQLSEQSPTPYSVLDQHFESCQGGKFPTYDDLLAMLPTILAQFTGTYIVLDALDECSEPDELIEFISTFRGWAKAVHLLVASQPRTVFLDSAAFEGALVVVLELDTTHADILGFVNSELALNFKLKHLKKAKDAALKIVDKSNGMFRMAACLLQELTRKRINPNIEQILAKLPNDLFGIYGRFLQPIDEDDFVYVATLLRWLAFSARPVTLLELDEALAINFSEPLADRWVFEPENRGSAEKVWDLLEGLVTLHVGPVISRHESDSDEPNSESHGSDSRSYGSDSESGSMSESNLLSDSSESAADPESSSPFNGAHSKEAGPVVTLAHSSVADYIVSKQFLDEYKHDLREAPSHTFLAQSCVTYLLHFENNPLNAHTLPQYPLARYAAEFWSHHLLRCHDRGVLQHSTMHLLEQGSQQYVAMNCMCDLNAPWRDPDWSRHAPWPLYLCSLIGFVEGVEIVLDNGADVNAAGGSALQAAARRGNVDTVRLLLNHGADVNAAGGEYGGALQYAVRNRHMDTVRLLLEHGADVNAVGGNYGSVLQGAASGGSMDIVRLLLDKGADVNAVGDYFGNALQAAAVGGNVDIVRILLEHGADVNAVGGYFGSALQAAARYGHADIVRILLEHGADVNTTGRVYGSALAAASVRGHKEIVKLLREHGALEVESGRKFR